VKGQFVTEDGAPRLERIVPIALVAAAGVGLLVVGSRRRKR
jgi:MYXO-CTERM domain-containing protein